MTNHDFQRWRIQMDLSPADAARALGVTERTIQNYEKRATVPRTVDLACAALVAKLAPFSSQPGR